MCSFAKEPGANQNHANKAPEACLANQMAIKESRGEPAGRAQAGPDNNKEL